MPSPTFLVLVLCPVLDIWEMNTYYLLYNHSLDGICRKKGSVESDTWFDAYSCPRKCDLTVDVRSKLKHFLNLHLYAKSPFNKLLSLSINLYLHPYMKYSGVYYGIIGLSTWKRTEFRNMSPIETG
jgi:hypothetical protein